MSKQTSQENQGIIPRAINHIFNYIKQKEESDGSLEVKLSAQEIYIDSVRDLLNQANVMTQNNQSLKYEAEQIAVKSPA